ncbi:hypothetical protein VTJ83DRAFT_1845 [Remersonia thermophila]|uniref:lytic cellulose monooxygenase (C4-dehydrogenating) n=1 Tax=Remersonia thermophila TaxID=72144 RepID=A0ABR4DIJ7_9PEZI
MKLLATLATLAATLATADAHYIFNILYVNGQRLGGEYTYVRRNSNSYFPVFPDILNSPDLRCNVGARPGNTQTATVRAGDRIGFKVFNNELIEHPGPGFIYMSKAPGSVNSYDGSGDWFKVYETGLCRGGGNIDTNWCSYNKDRLEFTIPPKTPPGEYLVRIEHIGLHEGHVNRAQFYITCAQLKVEGPGGGNPNPLVKIPGIYQANHPGIAYNKWTNNPAPYVMPGPRVWNGN